MSFPVEIITNLIINLSPQDIISYCQTNKVLNRLCNDEYFWEQYIKQRYFIDQIPTDKTYKETAFLADKILNELFNKELYPSYRVLSFIINNMEVEQILEDINGLTDQQIIDTTSFESIGRIKYQKAISKIFPTITLPPVSGFAWLGGAQFTHVVLNSNEKNFYHTFLRYVMVPTIYLTPKGPLILNLDADLAGYLLNTEVISVADSMFDFVLYDMDYYKRILFMRYLAPLKD